jgi:hypothetical protein
MCQLYDVAHCSCIADIGTGGKLTEEFAALLTSLWTNSQWNHCNIAKSSTLASTPGQTPMISSNNSNNNPNVGVANLKSMSNFKRVLQKCKPQFSGDESNVSPFAIVYCDMLYMILSFLMI